MRGVPFLPAGSPTPIIDGVRPVFVEHGADPTVAPGLDLPIKSICRFGTTYFEKWGPAATDWTEVVQPVSGGVAWADFLRGPATTGDMERSSANPAAANDVGGTILQPVNLGNTGSVTISGAAINAIQQSVASNVVSIPMVLPAGTFKYFTINLAAAPVATANPFVQMAIYSSRLSPDRYKYIPEDQIYLSDLIDVKHADVATFRQFNRGEITIEIPVGGVYHFAIAGTTDTATQQIGASAQSSFNRFLGMTARWGNGLANYNDSLVLGHARTHVLAPDGSNPLPDPFCSDPATQLKYLYYKSTGGVVDIPLFYIGFEPAA